MCLCICIKFLQPFNPIAVRKAKIVYNFGLSECTRVKKNLGKGNPKFSCPKFAFLHPKFSFAKFILPGKERFGIGNLRHHPGLVVNPPHTDAH